MPVAPLFLDTTILTTTIASNDTVFRSDIYTNPSAQPKRTQSSLIRMFGNRITHGAPCLGITTDIVRDNIQNGDYSAIGFVTNTSADDTASAALQYYDWCGTGMPQLWINDLCRITRTPIKPSASPTPVLLEVFEAIAKEHALPSIYLMVDDKEPERTLLPAIYKKYGYAITEECAIEGHRIMKKQFVVPPRGGKRARRRTSKLRVTRKRL